MFLILITKQSPLAVLFPESMLNIHNKGVILMFRQLDLPSDMAEILCTIYAKARKIDLGLTEKLFIQQIIDDWLKPYNRDKEPDKPATKKTIRLRNNIKDAMRLSGKTQAQLALETGINRAYISQIANGHHEPTVTAAVLLARATGCNTDDLFYVEPIEE